MSSEQCFSYVKDEEKQNKYIKNYIEMREVNGKPGQRLLTGSERAWMAGYGRKM